MSISSAVDASAVARVVGIKTAFKNLSGSVVSLPQRVALVGQGNTASTYATTKAQYTSALAVAQAYGFGSPVHLAALQLLPVNGDGIGTIPLTVYPLDDNPGSSAASVGDITPSGTPTVAASYVVKINNISSEPFVVNVGDAAADVVDSMVIAVNAVLDMPMVASDGTTKLTLTSKWKGTSANDLYIEVVGSTTAGNAFAYTQPVGGLLNPDVDDALDQVGNIWETMFLNCMDIADTASLVKYNTFGEGRWGALVRKPCVVFTGDTNSTVALATAVSDARKTDRVNAQLVAPASNDLPFVVAARQLARIVKLANNNPPHDYGSQAATGLTPGTDATQWTYLSRDEAVKKGSSTIEVRDEVVTISDVVTFYHPSGDPLPAYRYVVDIVKIMNIIFNLDLIFATTEWDGAPLVPDNTLTTNRSAKKPKAAVTAVANLIDSLAGEAIISDPETAKSTIEAGINGSNPKRLDVAFTIQISGNSNIISIDLNYGFFFGA